MKLMILAACAFVLSACGTIKSQDYTDLAIQKAVADARIEAAEQARVADQEREELLREALRLYIEQLQHQDGRRPHRPGGA